MTSSFSDVGLKSFGMGMLIILLLMYGLRAVCNQFDIDADFDPNDTVVMGTAAMICFISAAISGAILAFRGNYAEGMIVVLSAVVLLFLFNFGPLHLYMSLTFIIMLAICMVGCFKDEEKLTGVFTLFIIILLAVMLTYNFGMDLIIENPVIVGIIALIAAVIAIYILMDLMKSRDSY